jgi:hypothetical protein
LFKSTLLLSDNGTRHTTVRTWAEDANRRLVRKLLSQRRSLRALRKSRPADSLLKERSSLHWRSNSRLVVFSLLSLPGLDRVDVLMGTSWRERSWLSTRDN